MPILDTVGIAKKLKELYSKAITPDYLSSLRSGGPSLELPTPEMGVGQKLYKGALDRLGLNETDQEALNMAMGAVTGGFKPDTTPSSLSSSVGIGPGIMLRGKGKMNPENFAKWLDLWTRKFGVDPENLALQRNQQEALDKGISQSGFPMYVTQSRSGNHPYNSGFGSSEGGPIQIKETVRPKMPMTIISDAEFWGPNLHERFVGGSRTRNHIGSDTFYSGERKLSNSRISELAKSVLTPHEFNRVKSAYASAERTSEGLGAGYAARNGVDWVLKASPSAFDREGVNRPLYPTQIQHTDRTELSKRLSQLYEEAAIPPEQRHKQPILYRSKGVTTTQDNISKAPDSIYTLVDLAKKLSVDPYYNSLSGEGKDKIKQSIFDNTSLLSGHGTTWKEVSNILDDHAYENTDWSSISQHKLDQEWVHKFDSPSSAISNALELKNNGAITKSGYSNKIKTVLSLAKPEVDEWKIPKTTPNVSDKPESSTKWQDSPIKAKKWTPVIEATTLGYQLPSDVGSGDNKFMHEWLNMPLPITKVKGALSDYNYFSFKQFYHELWKTKDPKTVLDPEEVFKSWSAVK